MGHDRSSLCDEVVDPQARVIAANANRIHGLGFPKEWEDNVAKLSSPEVAKKLNIRYYFVDTHGTVEEFTAARFHRKHPRKKKKRAARGRRVFD